MTLKSTPRSDDELLAHNDDVLNDDEVGDDNVFEGAKPRPFPRCVFGTVYSYLCQSLLYAPNWPIGYFIRLSRR
jgi:hypothetical protein